ncbi:MAG: tetratricopeptide repeat protein [Leptospiraceae bacterium]|nr:tetratricopeptide repeat protein [Leptospiraceae bacterium]
MGSIHSKIAPLAIAITLTLILPGAGYAESTHPVVASVLPDELEALPEDPLPDSANRPLEFTEKEYEDARKSLDLMEISARLLIAFRYEQKAQIAADLRRINEIAPESAERFFFEALNFYQQNEKGRSLVAVDEAIKRKPWFARAWNLKGLLLSEADRLPEAMTCFQKAIELGPYHPTYVYNLASVMYRLGMQQEALRTARRATYLKPNLAEAHYLQGLLLRDEGDFNESAKSFESALVYGEESTRFILDYIQIAETVGNDEKVLDLCKRIENRDDPEVFRTLARIHIKHGEYGKAAYMMGRVLQKPEANLGDRKIYVFTLFKSGVRDLQIRIRRMTILDREKEALLSYLQELEENQSRTVDVRDPILNPVL